MTTETAKPLKLTAEQKHELIMATRGQLGMFKCHKEVLAVKIARLSFGYSQLYDAATHLLHPEDERLHAIAVPQDFLSQHNPVAPGYFVVYNAGTAKQYESWSPVDVFEDGYSSKPGTGDPDPDLVTEYLARLEERDADEDVAAAIDGERGG